MLDDRQLQRQLLTGIQLIGCSIHADQIFLRHFPGAWGSLDKRLLVQHKERKAYWCVICETKNHNTVECHLNLKNQQNHHVVYQTNTVAQTNKQNNLAND